jgi:hypothetical protein
MVGAGEMGTLDVTVREAASGPLPASGGLLFLNGSSESLAGALDQSNARISLSSTTGYQLTGDSRPAYAYGSYQYQSSEDRGEFALLPEPPSGSSIKTFCGSYVSTASTDASPIPFAIAAVPEGSAICVSPTFTWLGFMDAADTVSCSAGTGLFYGNANVDAGNQWGTGTADGDGGNWIVGPCGSGTGGGPDAGASGTDDATVD